MPPRYSWFRGGWHRAVNHYLGARDIACFKRSAASKVPYLGQHWKPPPSKRSTPHKRCSCRKPVRDLGCRTTSGSGASIALPRLGVSHTPWRKRYIHCSSAGTGLRQVRQSMALAHLSVLGKVESKQLGGVSRIHTPPSYLPACITRSCEKENSSLLLGQNLAKWREILCLIFTHKLIEVAL